MLYLTIIILYYTLPSYSSPLFGSIPNPHDSIKGIDQSIYIKRSNTSKRLKNIHLSNVNKVKSIHQVIILSIKRIHLIYILLPSYIPLLIYSTSHLPPQSFYTCRCLLLDTYIVSMVSSSYLYYPDNSDPACFIGVDG